MWRRILFNPIILIVVFLLYINSYGQPIPVALNFEEEECTIGVATGAATSDGRPMVWKTRDYSSARDNEVKYNASSRFKFISISNAGDDTNAWMGVNEHGFAVVNTLAYDLEKGSTGPGNGVFMRDVLGSCLTIQDFEHYLDSTNITGRQTRANFGVIDSTGAAFIFETSGYSYSKSDAANAPDNYLVRTNFSITGGGNVGIERFKRSSDLIHNFRQGDSLNLKSILRNQMRDFSDDQSKPVPVPYPYSWVPGRPFGYIYANYSICRQSSVSATVIQGVLPTEQAGFSTMWTILGQPATSVALPYWPVGPTPVQADGSVTSPLCDQANKIRNWLFDYNENDNYLNSYKLLDGAGGGLWTCTFPFEDSVLSDVKLFLDTLRQRNNLPVQTLLQKEGSLAEQAINQLQTCFMATGIFSELPKQIENPILFPNPLKPESVVSFYLKEYSYISINIFTSTGIKIKTLASRYFYPGKVSISLNSEKQHYPVGIYFLSIQSSHDIYTIKFTTVNGF